MSFLRVSERGTRPIYMETNSSEMDRAHGEGGLIPWGLIASDGCCLSS